MNWQHLRALLWLRWRLLVNQWRRAGAVNAALMTIVTVAVVVMAVPLSIACFFVGCYPLADMAPPNLLFVWDGVIVGFVFIWMIGLITELQRTEPLSLSKFLHLPVSIRGAFLINYVSSLLRLSLILFGPAMLGLALGLILSRGLLLALVLPLLASFLLMVTAVTYQFQGWLASLMSNPRRRRTVVVVTTMLFIVISQAPNLINLLRPWERANANPAAKFAEDWNTLDRELASGEIDAAEHSRRRQELAERQQRAWETAHRTSVAEVQRTAQFVNMLLPIGWLPLGTMAAAEGRIAPALWGSLGMTLIGAVSLWRAYRTTMGLYQGKFTAGNVRPAAAPTTSRPAVSRRPGVLLLERKLPGVSEPVSAVALGSLRSLMRSPEAKMMLLTLMVLGVIFGSMIWKLERSVPDMVRPLLAIGIMFVVLFGIVQLMANQFGFDRDGFRALVLCAASRRDILLGKNLAFAPLVLGTAFVVLGVMQAVSPLRLEHFLAMFPQYVSMYLVFCLLMNVLSIYTPMHIAAGSMKPSNPRIVPALVQMLVMTLVFPLSQAPLLVPIGVEAALEWGGWMSGAPVCLVLSIAECAGIILLYRLLLNREGELLQAREQRILESVTKAAA